MSPKWVRRALVAVMALAAIVLLIIGAAHTPIARERAFEWVRGRLERDLGLVVEADQLRYNVLTRSVSLENVRLSVHGERPFLQARAIRVTLTRNLFRGNVEPDRLSLEQPQVLIVRHDDGRTNLPASQSGSASSPSPIHLGLLSISALSLDVQDESAGSRIVAGPINLTIDTRAGMSRAGNFGPSPITVTLGSQNAQAAPQTLTGQFFGRLGFDGSRLVVEAIRLDSAEMRLGAEGQIDLIAEPMSIEAKTHIELDAARAGRLMGPDAPVLSGSAVADVTIRGPFDDLPVQAVINGQALRFQSSPDINLSAEGTYKSGHVDIRRVAIRSELGDADATGSLALSGSAGPSRLSTEITRADIDRLASAGGIKSAIKAGASASGHIDVEVDGPVSAASEMWQRVKARGSIELAPAGVGLSIQGRAGLSLQDGRWTVRHEIRSAVASATLAGEVSGDAPNLESMDRHRLSGRTRLQIRDIRALLPILQQAGLTMPPSLEGIHGEVDAQIVPRGTLQAPSVEATIAGRSIQIPDLAGNGELDAVIAIDQRAITAQSITVQLDSVHLSGAGSYDWDGRLESRFAARTDDVRAIATAFDLGDTLSGSILIEGDVRGTVQQPEGRAALTGTNLSAYGVPVGSMTASLQLKGDHLDVDATAPELETRLRGGLDTRAPYRFQADASLERTPLAPLLSAAGGSIPVNGTITAIVRATGAAERPTELTGTVDLRALDLQVGDVPLALASPSRFSIAPGAVAVDSLRLRVGKETVARLVGALALNDRRNGIDVRVNGSLSDLLDVAALAGSTGPAYARLDASDAQVNLDLHVGGSLMAPEPTGTLTLDAAAVRYQDIPPLTDVKLAVRIDRAQMALESLAARWQGAALTATGTLPLRMIVPEARAGATGIAAWGSNWLATLPAEPRTATLTARATDITALTIEPFVDPAQLQKIGANINASVSAEADGFALENLRASIVLDRAELSLAGVPLVQSTPTRLRLEQGQARIEELRWNAQGNELRVSGGAGLLEPNRTIDLVVDGAIDLRMLGAFADGIAPGGIAWPAITVKGPLTSPQIVGGFSLEAGELRLETPGLSASDFSGTVYIDATRRTLISLSGLVNGGPTTIDGTVTLDDFTSPLGRVTLTAQNVTLEYPEGFQTESNADLALTLGASSSTLTGRVNILSGVYREPIVISRTVLARFGQSATATVGTEPTFLSNLRLDITAATSDDIRVDNNYGRLDVSANLVVTGSADHPGLLGHLEAEPDGEVYLAGNTYRIQTLTIDFTNPRAIAPEVTFLADTRVGSMPIEIALQCTASGPCEREVRSQASGVTNEQAEAALFGISTDPDQAGAQLATLLSGELLGIVGRTARLDTLRLEQGGAPERSDLFDDPTLVAGDVDPASRLTIGKRLGEHVELAYSQDLSQNGFVMTTTYFAPKGLSFRALLLDNQNRSYEFRHEPRFGGRERPRRQVPPGAVVSGVTFSGAPGFPEQELRRQLQLTDGDRFDFSEWQQDREKLRRFYLDGGFYEARVRGRRVVSATDEHLEPTTAATAAEPGTVTLEYSIERGPATQLDVSGMALPDAVRDRIVARWASTVFDGFLERDAALIVKDHLYNQRYLQAQVEVTVERRENIAILHIKVDPGPLLTPRLEFEGNASIPTARLLEIVNSAGPLAAWLDPDAVSHALERLYQESGLLSAAVEVRPPEIAGNESVVRVVVREGGLWSVGRVTVGGAEILPKAASFDSPGSSTGDRYDPAVIAEHLATLEQRFRDEGFLDVRVVSETVLDREQRRSDVHVLVEPGPRSILASLEIEGARADDPTIARSLNLPVGKPIGASAVSTARRRLYETGVYRSVEIALEPAAGASSPEAASADRPVVAHVRVEERPRYNFRYGLAVNSDLISPEERDTRLGFAADLENRNVFGRGMTAGLSLRLRRDQEVGRVFLGANRFFGLPLRSTVFLSRGREDVVSTTESQIVSDITDISLEQVFRLRRMVDLRYGYGIGRNRTTISCPDSAVISCSPFDLTVRAARLQTSALVDRRNDPFDPVRGGFSSASLELSRPGLGSDISFVKSYLQHYQFVPMTRGLVLASAARVGLARTFRDEPLIPSERFFAGGATSVRGYHENDLGPRSIFGDAAGGSALLIANGELRFPVYRWVRGVGFVDLGNIYPAVGDILHTALQVGTGGGIRVNSPVGLLRFDLGVAVNPRPFDPSWTVHFGLGHSF
jgi:outer membrane protein insertion porin family